MGTTTQPDWELLANIGDCNPIDHGGAFIFRDKRGNYPPEMEVLLEDGENEYGEPTHWTVHRFILDKCIWQDGVLSDNPYHPECAVWFANDLDRVSRFADFPGDSLRRYLCSDDLIERAQAYRVLYQYYGLHEFDSYPLAFTDREEVEKRYNLN